MKNVTLAQILIISIVSFFLIFITTQIIWFYSNDNNMNFSSTEEILKVNLIFSSVYGLLYIFLAQFLIKLIDIRRKFFILVLSLIFIISIVQCSIFPCYGIITCIDSIKINYGILHIIGIIIVSLSFFIFLKWYLKPNNVKEV